MFKLRMFAAQHTVVLLKVMIAVNDRALRSMTPKRSRPLTERLRLLVSWVVAHSAKSMS